jgi:hypothetical protein
MLPLNNSKTIQLAHGIHSLLLSLHDSNNPNLISFMVGVSNWDFITIYVHILCSFFQKKSQVYQTYTNLFIVVKRKYGGYIHLDNFDLLVMYFYL